MNRDFIKCLILLSPFRMVCRNFILPEPANYVFFYPLFNLRKLLYIIIQSVHMMHDTRRNVPSHCKRHDKGKNNVVAGAKVWYTGKNTSRQRSSEKHEARSVFGEADHHGGDPAGAVSESPETALLLQAAGAGTADRFDSRALQHFCRTTLGSFAEVKSVELYLGSSPVFPSCSQTPARLRSLYDKAGRSSGATVWMDANVHGGEKTVTLCRALMDGGEAAGLIVLELDARMFGSLVLTKQKILNYQTTFLTDRSGTVLYSDSAIHDGWLRLALEHYRGGERKFTLTADGARYYVCSQYNALTHWVTYTVIREPALFPGAAPLKRYISLVVLGSAILFSCACCFCPWPLSSRLISSRMACVGRRITTLSSGWKMTAPTRSVR